MSRQKLFDKFLSAGFAQVNQNRAEYEHHASLFKFNYGPYLSEDKDIKILEVGFGLGQFLYFLNREGYHDFFGTEVSTEMFDFTQENLTIEKQKLGIVSNLEEFLPKHKNEYDLIVFNDVIEHMEKGMIVTYLEMMRQALKKDGQVLIKTNNVAAMTGARMRYEDFTHETSFTPYSLRQVLLVAGFSDVEIKPFTFPVTGPLRLIRKILQLLNHLQWRLIFWVEYTTQPEVVHEFMFAVAKK